MTIRMLLFMVIASAVIFLAHFFVYYSTVWFFGIEATFWKRLIAISLAFFSLSFVVSSVLLHYSGGNFSKWLYIGSSTWLGYLVGLLFACVISWMLVGVAFKFNIKPSYIAGSLFILSIIYGSYGIYNAMNPVVKEVEVKIKNLPPFWQNKKVVQLSDVHLGAYYGERFLSFVVEKVNLLKPDAVFITGDLFDGMDGNFDNVSDALNQIQAPDGIYFVTGNHETYFGLDKVNKILAQTKIKVLNDDVVDVKGLQIIGTLFPGDGQSRDIETVIKNNPNYVFGKPTILLHHAPTEIDQAKRLGVNLQLSGHTHKGQIFPFGYVTKLIYRGYDYGLHTEGDYNIYTTNGVGTWGPPMRTGNTPEIVDITLK